MKHSIRLFMFIAAVLPTLCLTSCLKDDEETILLPTPISINGIPSDYSATENPYISYPNAIIPNYQLEGEEAEEGWFVYRLDMTGIMNPTTHEWLDLYGTGLSNQNVWLSIDDTPKGLLVKNHTEDGTVSRKFDLVFLVDNSGSMDDESDALARDILDWANSLTNSGIDIQFGCVGYTGWESSSYWLNGAIDLTDQNELNNYLNYGLGTERTRHFGGTNAANLQNEAYNYIQYYYNAGWDIEECGMMALRFADQYFTFRNGTNRIYVNFTDEPNQPCGMAEWSVDYLNPSHGYWTPQQGTIHTVFSGSTNFSNYEEKPWLMSEYTGGTVLYASSYFSSVSLNDLPVTGAMQHSYSIYFVVPESMKDELHHSMRVTVLSQDQSVRAERNFSILFE